MAVRNPRPPLPQTDSIFVRLALRLTAFFDPGRDGRSVMGMPTSGRQRTSPKFNPRVVQGIGSIGQQLQRLAPSNPDRISLWIANDAGNLGNLNLTTKTGEQFWPLGAGQQIIIDDTTDEVWAIFDVGASGNVRVVEMIEHP